MKQPVAYLRRSYANPRRPGAISHEAQLAAVHDLAGADADRLLCLEDWGRSGRAERQHLRGEYAHLRQMIVAGEVSTLYSYSLSRLARSTRELLDVAEACRDAGVPIRLVKEGTIDAATATGRLMLTFLAGIATWEAELAGERATEAAEIRRGRGDRLGAPRYGTLPGEAAAAVVNAYNEAGTYLGAARLLTARGIPARRGAWHPLTVRAILERDRPDLIPRERHQGARARGPHRLSGLLRCACGATLSTMPRPAPQAVRYVCERGRSDPGHSRPFMVSEAKLLPWIMAEAGRLVTPERVQLAETAAAERAGLEAQRGRLLDMYQVGAIAREEWQTRLAAVDAAVARLDDGERIVAVPELDWTWAPEAVNAVLRALWSEIRLDEQMRPLEAVWRVPSWRAD
jgi:DNA invertase Pin-like site-specific DNA recombinase